MKTREKEICASFTVENEDNQLLKVLVTQDRLSHYSKEERYSKSFRLESPEGIAVYQTENPEIFKLANGTTLKRIKK
jgi:hypothetical protein